MSQPQSTSVNLAITGMTCAACVRRIEKALTKVAGVQTAHVNLVSHRAAVTIDPAAASVTQLTAAVHAAGYAAELATADNLGAAEKDSELRHWRRQAMIATLLSTPVVIIAMSHGAIAVLHGWFGATLQALLATLVVFGPGLSILRPAWRSTRHLSADMNTLVSMGVLAAWGYSSALFMMSYINDDHHPPALYFEAAAAILTFVLIGKMLESRSRRQLSDAVAGLMSLQPTIAHRLTASAAGDHEEDINVNDILEGDRLVVRPGERLPADGDIEHGTSTIDNALVTGESMPVEVMLGSLVRGGTLNQTGAFVMVVRATGANSALGRIVQAVELAQGSRAPIARLADQVSAIFVPIVLAIALITLGTWLYIDFSATGIAQAISHAVAVLVIACPCALGLATPAAVAVGSGRAATLGVLMKGGATVEIASRVTMMMIDKTGTLTTGRPTVSDIIPLADLDEINLLTLAAAAERSSEHPLATAIVAAAQTRSLHIPRPLDVTALPGKGITATVNNKAIAIGTVRWLSEIGINNARLTTAANDLATRGRTPVAIAMNGQAIGVLGLLDQATPAAREAVAHLRTLGIAVAMVTGDRAEAAHSIANDLGITTVYAETQPSDKARLVAEAQAQGHIVAMVGDGLNDAPALAGADLGIAIGTGTDIAQAAADMVLVQGGIAGLSTALDIARRTLRTIRQNLVWAFAYNIIGIPLAAGVLIPLTGWSLSPMFASAAMALSSVSVLGNSLRLRYALRKKVMT